MNQRVEIWIRASPGELLDRISILALKSWHAADPGTRKRLLREVDALTAQRERAGLTSAEVQSLAGALADINRSLWEVEDALRDREWRSSFGPDFVDLARWVCCLNDRRTELKGRINRCVGAAWAGDEKVYSPLPNSCESAGH